MSNSASTSSTSPLIAVLLVTSSSRGQNVVFSFPKRPHVLKRYSRIRYYATTTDTIQQDRQRDRDRESARNKKNKNKNNSGHPNNLNNLDREPDFLDTNKDPHEVEIEPNPSRGKPRQRSFDHSDRDNKRTMAGGVFRDRERERERERDRDRERERDEQEEDDPDSDEDYLDGLTDSDESESSTDAEERDGIVGGDQDSEDEFNRGREDHFSSSNHDKEKERDRTGRSKTREKLMGERSSKSRVRSISRSRTRGAAFQQQQPASSVGDYHSDSGNNNNRNSRNNNNRTSSPSTLKSYTDFLGYPTAVLAALLAPKRELCQQKFELIVDDLAFLGHPVCVGEDGVWSEVKDEEEEGDEEDIEEGGLQSEKEQVGDDRGRSREMRKSTAETSSTQSNEETKEGADPRRDQQQHAATSHHHVHYDETSEIHPHSSSHDHHPTIKTGRSSSKSPSRHQAQASSSGLPSQTSASKTKNRSRSSSKKPSSSSSSSSSSLTLFHLVLVLSRPSTNPIGSNFAVGSTTSTSLNGPDSISLSSWLQFWYDNVAFKMAAALYAEQCRCDYVRDEAEKLIALRERCSEDGASYSSYMTQALATSSLARSLRDLHTSIARSSGAFVSINDRIDAHLQLPPLIHDPTRMLNALDVQTELDGNDPVFLAGEGRPDLSNQLLDEEEEEAIDSGGTRQAEENKRLQKLRKSSNSLLPEQFTFIEYTRTTGPFLLPWKTLLILNDRPNSASSGDSKSQGKARRRRGSGTKREENNEEALIDEDEDEDDEDGLDGGQAEGEDETALPSSGIESWAKRFTNLLKPTLSGVPTFAELADLLEWDLYEDVYPMARHLIYYREARVVDVPRINSTYAVSPMLDLEDLPQLSDYWAITFPNLQPLPSLLSALSYSLQPLSSHFEIPSKNSIHQLPPTSYGSPSSMNAPSNSASASQRPQLSSHQYSQTYLSHAHIQRQKQQCLDALVWLLRHGVVVPLQVRLRLVATEAVKRKARELKFLRLEKRRSALERKRAREERRLVKIEKLRSRALRQAEKAVAKDLEVSQSEDQNREMSLHKPKGESPEENHRGRVRSRSRSNPPGPSPSMNPESNRKRSTSGSRFSKDPVTGLMSATRPRTATKSSKAPSSSSTNFNHPSQLSPAARHQYLAKMSPEKRKVESLRFERRPISRSRSPSTLLERSAALSLTSNTSPNAPSTSGAVSSNGSGSAGAGAAVITGSGSGSRPGTPRGRILPINSTTGRGRSSSSAEVAGAANNSSLPNSAGWSRRGRKSRSPSRARMRIKGFGQDEEIIVDDDIDVPTNPSASSSPEEQLRKEESSSNLYEEGGTEGLGLNLTSTNEVDPASNEERPPQIVDLASETMQTDVRAEDTAPLEEEESETFEISDFSSSSDETDDDFEDEDLDELEQGVENWDFEPSLISEPSRADREESEWIVAMLDGKEEWLTQRFLRLLPYLNGKHSVDEILYREELRRRELRAILSQLSDEIITFVHP